MTRATAFETRDLVKFVAIVSIAAMSAAMTSHGAVAGDEKFSIQLTTSDLQNATNTPTKAETDNPAIFATKAQADDQPRKRAQSDQ